MAFFIHQLTILLLSIFIFLFFFIHLMFIWRMLTNSVRSIHNFIVNFPFFISPRTPRMRFIWIIKFRIICSLRILAILILIHFMLLLHQQSATIYIHSFWVQLKCGHFFQILPLSNFSQNVIIINSILSFILQCIILQTLNHARYSIA